MVHRRMLVRSLLWAAALFVPGHASWACGPYSVGLYEFGSLLYRVGTDELRGIDKHLILDWAPEDTVVASLVLSRSRVSAADQVLLRRHLESMLTDGEFDQILRQHLGPDMARQVRYEASRNKLQP